MRLVLLVTGKTSKHTMAEKDSIVEVVLDLPIDKSLYYRIPEGLANLVSKGKRLLLPLGRRRAVGYAIDISKRAKGDLSDYIPPAVEIKDIIDVLDEEPIFCERDLTLYRWISTYYFAPLGEVIKTALVGEINPREDRRFSITKEGGKAIEKNAKDTFIFEILCYINTKGKVSYNSLARRFKGKPLYHALSSLKRQGFILEEVYLKRRRRRKTVERLPLYDEISPSEVFSLSQEQKRSLKVIKKGIKCGKFFTYLLFGVTGSGKTEVYLRALEETLRLGRKAIFLVPEISLTQTITRLLFSRFPNRVAVIHSGLTERERYDHWQRIKNNKVDMVFGARSAIFSPMKDLGLIIVDEEHDPSYKQEEGVRYNARDVAIMMGKLFKATVILGSATPSIESFNNAKNGRFTLLELPARVKDRDLPEVEIVDIKTEPKDGVLSKRMREAIKSNLSRGLQTILFLNRRGFSFFILCKDCGYVCKCQNCNVSLTFHRGLNLLRCHYCNLSKRPPEKCPQCYGYHLLPIGYGTERLEEEIRRVFPGSRVARLDRDTLRKKSQRGILDEVGKGEIDILIGTQVVTKGHHFPKVTLVGVISGDTSLNFPDFRASERTFQLIAQVAGRAGRGEVPGKVIVQTFNPLEHCFQMAAKHNYHGLFQKEIDSRREAGYPPFWRIVNLRFEGKGEDRVSSVAELVKRVCDGVLKKTPNLKKKIDILGPTPAFLSRLRDRYRWNMLIKGKDVKTLHTFVKDVRDVYMKGKGKAGVKLIIDIDPINLL